MVSYGDMRESEQRRRSFLSGVGAAGITRVLAETAGPTEGAVWSESVLGANEGLHLLHFRDQCNIFIKFGSATGSNNFAMGTQQVMRSTGIPIHRHLQMEEAFYVLEGAGTVMLEDVPRKFARGGTINIPKNTWHGFQNPDHELVLLWVVCPAGLDGFFRETCTPPGAPPKQLTREQIKAIAKKYATEFR